MGGEGNPSSAARMVALIRKKSRPDKQLTHRHAAYPAFEQAGVVSGMALHLRVAAAGGCPVDFELLLLQVEQPYLRDEVLLVKGQEAFMKFNCLLQPVSEPRLLSDLRCKSQCRPVVEVMGLMYLPNLPSCLPTAHPTNQ